MTHKRRQMIIQSLIGALILASLAACRPSTPEQAKERPSPTLTARTPKSTFTPIPSTKTPTLVPTITPVESGMAQAPTTAGDGNKATPSLTNTPKAMATATAAATTTPPSTPSPASTKALRMDSPEYGMQAFPWWRPEVASRDFQKIREAGFGWCKANFGWRDIEGAAKGAFDWSHTDRIVKLAEDVGLDLVVRVDHQPAWSGGGFPVNGPPDDYQDLADFLTALAGRYRGRIRAYEVWNEPNLAREWGGQTPNPAAYVEMLGIAYQALKSADPNAMVVSAGLSPTETWSDQVRPDDKYLENMYIAMGNNSEGYFDVLGAHGAGYKSPPERDPAQVAANPSLGGSRAFCFRRVEDLRAIMVKHGDTNKQIALLEFGWTSDPRPESPYNWHAVSEETKADYLVRAYQFAEENWSPWIGLMSLIYICDPDWTPDDEQYWWAITDPSYPEFEPRPAYTALKAMPK